jgi:archaellum biogenesis protein FlaJ (TadC family)
MAPLQKRAWWGLGVGLAFAVAFALVFVLMGGIQTFDTDQNFRLIIDALLIGALVANLVIVNVPLRNPKITDERDIRIVERAPRVQWLAIIFTLVAWVIALTEAYHETHLMPTVYLFVMFMSVLIVSTLAQCLGIVLGYWRANRYG